MYSGNLLKPSEKLYISGYKIYRSDAQYRKGVLTLIKTSLNVKCAKVETDTNGRYLKIRMIDLTSNKQTTLSNLYLEPTFNSYSNNLPESLFKADIVIGDCNDSDLGLTKKGVYHFKNISITSTHKVPNKISDHDFLIAKAHLLISKRENLTKIEVLSKQITTNNELQNILLGQNQDLDNPIYTKEISTNNEQAKYYCWNTQEAYEEFREWIRKSYNNRIEEGNKYMEAMLNDGTNTREAWAKLAGIMLLKSKSKIYNDQENKHDIINGFKKLYKHNEHRLTQYTTEDILHSLYEETEKHKDILLTTEPTQLPFSNATDRYGIKHKH